MAATKVKKSDTGQGAGNVGGGFRNRIPDMPNVDNQSSASGSFGYLLVLVLFALVFVLVLPLVGMMYMDTMVVKREARQQMEKVEKLRKSIEEERKNVNPVLIPNQFPDGRTPKNP
jgi:hypothetical protein